MTGRPTSGRDGNRKHRRRCGRLAAILALALACGAAITACGSAASPGSANRPGSGETSALKFAKCMRTHGLSNFPDPGAAPRAYGDLKGSPAFRSAMKTCNKLQPSGTSTGTPVPEAQRIAALAQARCIRDHGAPRYPDPTFPSAGGEFIPPAPGFDPSSPAFKHAAAACGLSSKAGLPHGG
jgi:hypothetical protein